MNQQVTQWREATELETKLYWEIVDEYAALMQAGLNNSDIDMFARGQAKKKAAYQLLNNAGYRVDGSGIWMRVEDDILDQTLDPAAEDAVATAYGLAMIAMRHGPSL